MTKRKIRLQQKKKKKKKKKKREREKNCQCEKQSNLLILKSLLLCAKAALFITLHALLDDEEAQFGAVEIVDLAVTIDLCAVFI